MKTKQAKATYETPRIRKVNLVADELAVTGCKRNMVSANVCNRGGTLINSAQGS